MDALSTFRALYAERPSCTEIVTLRARGWDVSEPRVSARLVRFEIGNTKPTKINFAKARDSTFYSALFYAYNMRMHTLDPDRVSWRRDEKFPVMEETPFHMLTLLSRED